MTIHQNMLYFIDGQRNWTSGGCTTIDDGSGVIQCNCTHLTNFAILVVSLGPLCDNYNLLSSYCRILMLELMEIHAPIEQLKPLVLSVLYCP